MSQPYLERPPRPDLAAEVACVWRYDREDGPEEIQRIVPDGCPELVIHLGAPHAELGPGQTWIVQPTPLFAGQLTRPLHLRSRGAGRLVAVRFKPAGARRFVGRPMHLLTDGRVALAELHGAERARDLLAAVETTDDPLTVVEAYVADILETAPAPPAFDAVSRSVDLLSREEGRVEAEHLAETSGLPLRQLQRQFLDVVGVSPRLLRGVMRVRRITAALREGAEDLAEASLAAGYFDQAQMSREFRRFVGISPAAFLSGDEGLALSLATA
jgi:AraC-like DNA-binding protein